MMLQLHRNLFSSCERALKLRDSLFVLHIRFLQTDKVNSTQEVLSGYSGTSQIDRTVRVPQYSSKSTDFSIPDFTNHKEVYKSKPFSKLFRAYIVFKLCSYETLVENQLQILKWTRKLLGSKLFVVGMKKTFYGQFMGGSTRSEIMSLVEGNTKFGILPMIAYTALETHGGMEESYMESMKLTAEGISKSLEYANDMKDLTSKRCIATAKLTAIQHPEVFRNASSLITLNRKLITKFKEMCSTNTESVQFMEMVQKTMTLNNSLLSMDSSLMNMEFHLKLYKEGISHFKAYKSEFASLNINTDDIHKTEDILEELGKKAEKFGVVLIWDAEQTYLQPAMDVFTLDAMRKCNQNQCTVYNTYQNYLKDAVCKVRRDIALAEEEGFCWGGKLVRGAYMEEERRLAQEQKYEDPVNPSYDATTDMYYSVVDYVLQKLKTNKCGKIQVVFATHSDETVKHVVKRLQSEDIDAGNDLRFAQLLGMRDHVSFALGQAGIPVSKLVHYGEVEECIAYLSRRVKENRGGLATAQFERDLLRKELVQRLRRRRN